MRSSSLVLITLTCCAGFSEPHKLTTTQSLAYTPQPGNSSECNPKGTFEAPVFTSEELYGLVQRFHETFIYPNNVEEAQKIKSPLFAENCQGNIDITRTFNGAELNTEYVFGSFGNVGKTQSLNLLGVPLTWNMTHFSGIQNIASFAATFQFYIPVLNITLPLEIWTWMSFNSRGQVNQYDATFRYTEYYIDTILTLAMPALNASTTQEAATKLSVILIQNICATAAQACNGTNTQYDDYNDCVQYLTVNVPLGQAYQAGQNTLLCRMIHSPMVAYRPSVHCPHIGPSGGGMCVNNLPYQQKVEGPYTYFTNAPWLPRFPSNFNREASGGPLPTPSQNIN